MMNLSGIQPNRVTHSHAKWNAKREWVTQRRASELLSHRLALIAKLSDTFEKENLKEGIKYPFQLMNRLTSGILRLLR